MLLFPICLFLKVVAGEQFWKNDNKTELSGRLLKTLEKVSLVQCVLKCKHFAGCHLIGYEGQLNHCRFYQKIEKNIKITSKDYVIFFPVIKKEKTQQSFVKEIKSVNPEEKDCLSIYQQGNKTDGIYTSSTGVKINCDQTTNGGGWTFIQRRTGDSVNFYRGWEEYKNGFGSLEGDFWLGNDLLHHLANPQLLHQSTLRIDMTFDNNLRYWAKYDSFSIGNEQSKYKITIAGFTGNVDDAMTYHNNMNFSTFDSVNNNLVTNRNCASEYKGAWWYHSCYYANLNGNPIIWKGSRVIKVEMKTRRNV